MEQTKASGLAVATKQVMHGRIQVLDTRDSSNMPKGGKITFQIGEWS